MKKMQCFSCFATIVIYNNQLPANDLIKSIGKMLDDTVYNENSNAICYYQISRKIVRHLVKNSNFNSQDYYSDLWLSPQSFFNRKNTANLVIMHLIPF